MKYYFQKGSLARLIEENKDKAYIKESILIEWLKQLAGAIKYLHEEEKIVHCDIKPL